MNTQAQIDLSAAFGLVVRFTLRPGHEEEFDDLVAATIEEIRYHEPGTLVYLSHSVEGEPHTRIFYELYRDRAAFEAHETQPHVQHFLAQRDRFLQHTQVERLNPLTYAGIAERTG